MPWRSVAVLLVVVAAAMAGNVQAQAQDAPKPVLVMSINNFDGLVGNLKYLGTVLEDAQYLSKLAKMTTHLTKGDTVDLEKAAGIDGTKPVGMAIYTDGQSIKQLSFIGVSDADALLAWLKPLVGEPKKNEAGIYEIASPRLTAFAKVDNGWMFWALSPEQLSELPDPAAALGDLPGKYDFAARVIFSNVPEDVRSLVIGQLRARLETAAPAGDESEAEAAFRRETTTFFGRTFDRFANESEHITFGANFAEDTTQIKAQAIIKPVPDSSIAKHFAELGPQTTRFGGVFTNSSDKPILSVGMTGKLAPETVGDLKSEIEAYRAAALALIDGAADVSDADRQVFKDLGSAIVDSMQASVAAGRLDLAVKIAPGSPSTLFGAMHIAGGNSVVAQLDKLAAATKDDPNSGFKADEAVHKDVRIHSFVAPNDPEFTALLKSFGKGKLYLAVNDTTLYFGTGPKGIDLIKQAIDAPEQADSPPLRVSGRGAALFRMLPPPPGGGNAQLLTSVIALQLQVGEGFVVTGQTPDGNLVLDMTFDKGFLRLGGFMIPTVGNLLLPSIDLNNLGGTFGF